MFIRLVFRVEGFFKVGWFLELFLEVKKIKYRFVNLNLDTLVGVLWESFGNLYFKVFYGWFRRWGKFGNYCFREL